MSLPPGLRQRTREELALLVPEYLLAGHLIDRAGMPHLVGAFGRDVMRDIAIEEWMGASPVYTKRMQRALRFEGDSVETIFKGIQLDIGAPPQFMDFRYRVVDHDYGEFWLDHCGALMDVEPMGPDFVVAMCHDIEDPTFEATATATNRRAQVRPIHRPPRIPADRAPHCHWTVTIADDHHPVAMPGPAQTMAETRAAVVELDAIAPDDAGRSDYRGPLLADLQFGEWSRSALLRVAEEVCLQGHLLTLSFIAAVRRRVATDEEAIEFASEASSPGSPELPPGGSEPPSGWAASSMTSKRSSPCIRPSCPTPTCDARWTVSTARRSGWAVTPEQELMGRGRPCSMPTTWGR